MRTVDLEWARQIEAEWAKMFPKEEEEDNVGGSGGTGKEEGEGGTSGGGGEEVGNVEEVGKGGTGETSAPDQVTSNK